ncbi:hypothetical protein HHI36_005650 [Cryptolaemus montrouzieri]|uniref:Uncharacterized protein n=1 Tax=Cryptolaemus montrouzieri TaxID=559131 RepID=A0ABD2NUS2_9CUCU
MSIKTFHSRQGQGRPQQHPATIQQGQQRGQSQQQMQWMSHTPQEPQGQGQGRPQQHPATIQQGQHRGQSQQQMQWMSHTPQGPQGQGQGRPQQHPATIQQGQHRGQFQQQMQGMSHTPQGPQAQGRGGGRSQPHPDSFQQRPQRGQSRQHEQIQEVQHTPQASWDPHQQQRTQPLGQMQQVPEQSSPVKQMPETSVQQRKPQTFQDQRTQKGSQPRGPSVQGAADKTLETYRPRTILSLTDQMAEMSLFPKKNYTPGTKGRKIQIETNHIQLNLGELKIAYHYDVQINPDIPKKFLRDVMEEFRKRQFPQRYPAFDGRKNLYSPLELMKEGQELNDEISIPDGISGKVKIFKVCVKFANTVDLSPLHNMRMTKLSPQEAIQCVEIVLRNSPSMRCIQAGRNFFTPPPRIIDLGEGMEMYQGFYQSVVRGWKPLLNIDVAHKAFPKETDLISLTIELCSSYYQRINEQDLKTKRLTLDQNKTLTKFLRTLRIVYEIRSQPGSKKEYRVNGLKECPRDAKFRPDNGPEMTVEEYFARKKNYRLQYPLMPTIWVGNPQRKDPILLPAELCMVVPGQPVNRKMTEGQTSSMIKYAATSTTVRKDKIMKSLNDTRHNDDLCIRQFGFSIGNEFEQIQARVLAPPVLEYDKRTVMPSKGIWRQENVKFFKGAEIKSWTIISACGPLNDIGKLADMIYSFGPKTGMSLKSKAFEPFQILRGRPVSPRDIIESLRKCCEQKYDLVFVIIPDSGQTYSDVKKAAELNIGCLTQCIKRKTMMKLNPSTVNNILLKVNSKLNGTNHFLHNRPSILDEPCMIMGADVTHPSPDSQNIPSVAAVTASHDSKAFCYNIACRLQSPKTEIIADLKQITREHLFYFYDKNRGQKPRRIVFFRDGVSEGQFKEVLIQEVRAIRDACMSLEAGYQPKITFLVVQKRHHTRFFPKNQRDSEDRNFNVPAGTCVDTNITNPNMQDFYLVSHASIQGVAKPTKYCTLHDDNEMTNDDIEELTYHLCHLFTRCNRSVSYPAPTYYAHLAAARAKVYIENDALDLGKLENEQKRISILDCIRKQQPMFFV